MLVAALSAGGVLVEVDTLSTGIVVVTFRRAGCGSVVVTALFTDRSVEAGVCSGWLRWLREFARVASGELLVPL